MKTEENRNVMLRVLANSIVFDDFYEIPFHRIDTHEKLVRWIFHLHHKTWFTTDLAGKLIAEVSDKYGWKLDMQGI